MMAAPRCANQGCDQRVKFDLYPSKGEPRYRTYCSRRCVGLARIRAGHFAELRKKRTARFYAAAIRRAVGDEWQEGQPVTLRQLIAVAREGYRQGWQSRNMRDEQRSARAA